MDSYTLVRDVLQNFQKIHKRYPTAQELEEHYEFIRTIIAQTLQNVRAKNRQALSKAQLLPSNTESHEKIDGELVISLGFLLKTLLEKYYDEEYATAFSLMLSDAEDITELIEDIDKKSKVAGNQ